MISAIQDRTSKAVSSVDIAIKEVNEGRVIIEKVGLFLGKILGAAKHTVIQVEQIVSASELQLSNVQDVGKAINEVASIAEGSAVSTKQASSTIEEMTAAMEEMSSTAQELAGQASNLQELVSKFKVKPH